MEDAPEDALWDVYLEMQTCEPPPPGRRTMLVGNNIPDDGEVYAQADGVVDEVLALLTNTTGGNS